MPADALRSSKRFRGEEADHRHRRLLRPRRERPCCRRPAEGHDELAPINRSPRLRQGRVAVIPISTLVANQLECIAASLAAGTDPSTARGSWFHVDCAAFPIASHRTYNALFRDLKFSGSCIDLKFV